MKVAICGVGATGTRLARQLVSSPAVEQVELRDERQDHLAAVVASLGPRARIADVPLDAPTDADVVVLAADAGLHLGAARRFLGAGVAVVSVGDDLGEAQGLLELDAEARERGVPVVVGAGFGPGLTCVLAAHAAARFDEVHEIHVAKVGTGGPACARQHHRALARSATDWRGSWVRRPGGSGRELCWFPDPIGGQDCYRAELADPALLVPAFPGVQRVTARLGATRRDRLTARLPMLWPTHPEGGPGAVRVEVRGRRGGASDVVVLGAMDRPAVAAGAVAALAVLWIGEGRIGAGAGGLAGRVDPVDFLTALRSRGVRAAAFQGSAVAEPA